MVLDHASRQIPTYCPLCVSRCGATATVRGGTLVALDHDPSHPTGRALCVNGKAAPELVTHHERLLHPIKRTTPKGTDDPGWQRISWEEALDTVAQRLPALARDHGPESVVLAATSPSTSAMSDAIEWVQRLQRGFGSPNLCAYMELCGWGRYLAPLYTYGASVPGVHMPDLDHAGCILYWGPQPVGVPARTRDEHRRRARPRRASSSSIRDERAWPAGPTTGCACARAPMPRSRWRT